MVLPGRTSGPVADHHRIAFRRVGGLARGASFQAVQSIVRLPDDVGLLSLREIVPVMAELSSQQRLNLWLEALSAAVHLRADVAVASENDGPLLREAVSAAGLHYSTV